MKMMEIGTYFGKRWFVADEGFKQPGLYYWNELQQAHTRVWKPGRPLDIPGEVDALRKERVVLQDENESLRVELRKPSDIEVLAERLAKVEDRLAHTPSIDAVTRELNDSAGRLDDRITKVADIIGERVSGLADEIAAVQDLLGEKSRSPGALYYASRIAQLADAVRELNPGWRGWKGTDGPAFPTGGAGTAEAAAEAVLPVPQRGDRVRLDRVMLGQYRVPDGWHTVTGAHEGTFQICIREAKEIGDLPSWHAYFDNSLIQELHHADHT